MDDIGQFNVCDKCSGILRRLLVRSVPHIHLFIVRVVNSDDLIVKKWYGSDLDELVKFVAKMRAEHPCCRVQFT